MAQTRISHFKTPKLDQVKPLPGGACPELWALLYFMVAASKPLDWSRHVGSWWGKELWHWSRCKRVWGGNPSREPPPESVHLSKAQRFSSQEAGLKKTNRLNPPVFGRCDFSDYNGILESKRKKKKKRERGIWEERLFVFTSPELWLISFEVLLTLYRSVLQWIYPSSPRLLWGCTSLFLSSFTTPPHTYPPPPLWLAPLHVRVSAFSQDVTPDLAGWTDWFT